MSDPKFEPQVLTRVALAKAVENAAENTPGISEQAKKAMVELYVKFRYRIGPALGGQEHSKDPIFWITVISDMMKTLSKVKLNGVEKKIVLVEVLHIVANHEIPPEARESAQLIIDMLISPSIDLAIHFAKNTKNMRAWFKKTCGCC